MDRKFILLFLLTFRVFLGHSQNNSSNAIIKKAKIDIGFEGIGLAIEPSILTSVTLDVSVGIGGYYNISESNFDYFINLKNQPYSYQ